MTLPISNYQKLKMMPQMKRFKLIDELQYQMELDIFGKSAKVIAKNFRPCEVKAMLMIEHNPTPLLLDNVERLMKEFAEHDAFEFCIVFRNFLQKHNV